MGRWGQSKNDLPVPPTYLLALVKETRKYELMDRFYISWNQNVVSGHVREFVSVVKIWS